MVGRRCRWSWRGVWLDDVVSVWNMFGPTETTVWSTMMQVTDAALSGVSVPLGRPIANTVCRVLDGCGLVPVGVPGELFIGGLVSLVAIWIGRI